jgi:hypothetical protein
VFHLGVNYRDWNDEDALRKTVEGMYIVRWGRN